MPIQVTCPSCLARFTVSDKYAGKKGPCPKCKKEITVPDKSQEVIIHAPEPTGPKDSKGVSVLKPIKRTEFSLSNIQLSIAGGITFVAILMAFVGRFAFTPVPWWYLSLGAIALSYPVAWAGYAFLKDDELGGYFGRELAVRLGACSAIFAATWGLYWFLAYYLGNKTLADVDGISFAIFLGVMIVGGALGSLACLEMEFGQSLLHYVLYLGITFLLAMVAGAELAEPLSSNQKSNPYGLPNMPKPSPAKK
jgi:hypothetical protein